MKPLLIFHDKILRNFFKLLNLNNLSDKNNIFLFSKQFKAGLTYVEYFDYLLQSKFILCPKGFYSPETFRHFEALHTGGIVISEKMPQVSIYKNNPFITYKDYSELKKIFNQIQKNEFDLDSLRERHAIFYKNRFTTEAISNRITGILKEHLPNKY